MVSRTQHNIPTSYNTTDLPTGLPTIYPITNIVWFGSACWLRLCWLVWLVCCRLAASSLTLGISAYPGLNLWAGELLVLECRVAGSSPDPATPPAVW